MRYFFARLDEKCKLLGNFEKTLKIFDENSIEKLNFYFIFIIIFKMEPCEITPFFYNNFFCFGGISPFPRLLPCVKLSGQADIRTILKRLIEALFTSNYLSKLFEFCQAFCQAIRHTFHTLRLTKLLQAEKCIVQIGIIRNNGALE